MDLPVGGVCAIEEQDWMSQVAPCAIGFIGENYVFRKPLSHGQNQCTLLEMVSLVVILLYKLEERLNRAEKEFYTCGHFVVDFSGVTV